MASSKYRNSHNTICTHVDVAKPPTVWEILESPGIPREKKITFLEAGYTVL